MIVRSIQQPAYNRHKDSGLAGQGPKKGFAQNQSGKTFEEYLMEAFQGEVVQKGNWVSPNLSDLGQKNLRKM
ncbi:hypothetical protein EHQ96_11240 [Leptospira levettii]|uniref:Uncharacterized protein n=4 Tax=Leptospira TaxID=171 RepID=A0A2N0AZR7_9LEPT|nr:MULTISPECIES: hypothetical protein [Leptospira]PKA27723.1 hypothetical protein CH381_04240 [Leptospira sp. mixed culture ATI2-C-A1]MBL0955330.1 hypothetical protein [Leptospira sp.]MCG6148160.1 hypothetical protein [Leptospira levettii]MCW7461885.1 hypothetical protein [Leptospira limi]MCW7464560.1 hypothetical protein [Leptospira levettii]